MIVVASTIAPWKAGSPEGGDVAWLRHAEAMSAASPEPLTWFLAMEQDARGAEPYRSLMTRIGELITSEPEIDFHLWSFRVDDNSDEIDSNNRLIRICTGRNLAHEYARRHWATHVLFLDSDIEVQDDACIEKLLETEKAYNAPMVAGHVPNYGLTGPPLDDGEGKVQRHWTTAGFLMFNRDVFRNVQWSYDIDTKDTDDPWTQKQAVKMGFPMTVVRHDVLGIHVEPLIAVESRQADKEYRH